MKQHNADPTSSPDEGKSHDPEDEVRFHPIRRWPDAPMASDGRHVATGDAKPWLSGGRRIACEKRPSQRRITYFYNPEDVGDEVEALVWIADSGVEDEIERAREIERELEEDALYVPDEQNENTCTRAQKERDQWFRFDNLRAFGCVDHYGDWKIFDEYDGKRTVKFVVKFPKTLPVTEKWNGEPHTVWYVEDNGQHPLFGNSPLLHGLPSPSKAKDDLKLERERTDYVRKASGKLQSFRALGNPEIAARLEEFLWTTAEHTYPLVQEIDRRGQYRWVKDSDPILHNGWIGEYPPADELYQCILAVMGREAALKSGQIGDEDLVWRDVREFENEIWNRLAIPRQDAAELALQEWAAEAGLTPSEAFRREMCVLDRRPGDKLERIKNWTIAELRGRRFAELNEQNKGLDFHLPKAVYNEETERFERPDEDSLPMEQQELIAAARKRIEEAQRTLDQFDRRMKATEPKQAEAPVTPKPAEVDPYAEMWEQLGKAPSEPEPRPRFGRASPTNLRKS